MRNINKDYSIIEFPTQPVIASGLITIASRIIEGGQNLIAQAMKANADSRLNSYYQKRMQKQLDIGAIDQMPLEMKLRMGFHRS